MSGKWKTSKIAKKHGINEDKFLVFDTVVIQVVNTINQKKKSFRKGYAPPRKIRYGS